VTATSETERHATGVIRPSIAPAQRTQTSLTVLVLIFVGFISLGLPDGLLGVAFPSIRQTFSLPLDALGAVFFTGVCGYLAASLASGWIVNRIGVAFLLTLSAIATAIALIGYALAPSWWVIVALGLVSGLGAGAIDAGLNSYVALMHSQRLLAWLHAFFGIGAASGPAIMMAVLDAGYPWQMGYGIVGTAQLGLGACFYLTRRKWRMTAGRDDLTPQDRASGGGSGPSQGVEAIQERAASGRRPGLVAPAIWLSVFLFLVYTGVETTAGQWAYTLLVEGRGVETRLAGLAVSAFWGALAVGRVLSGLFGDRVAPVNLIRGGMLGMLAGAALVWVDLTTWLTLMGLGLIGLAAGPVFPAMIGVTPARFGAGQAATIIGFQVAAASLGIAGLPALAGILAARIDLEIIATLLVISTVGMLALNELVNRLVTRPASATI
jgi:fucose permease